MDSLLRIAETAEKYNVCLFLEPLNRYEDHMINTVEQAVSIIEQVNSRRIKVIGDFFHMNIEEENLTKTIEAHYRHVGYYHLADSNRLLPGHGHTDFKTAFLQLKRLEYSGYLSLECRISEERGAQLGQTIALLRSWIAQDA
jgi:sugar phosphate isomerase/epimerase